MVTSKPRVLFVDDDSLVLDGLRRMLRSRRQVWEMDFAAGGREALEKFAEQPFDVIVSDMRMPGMDGAELLRRVASEYPDTVRLVLSGQSEHEQIFRAIGPAQQFLSKPCNEALLVQTVERACGLKTRLQNDELRHVVSQIGSLPSLPEIYRLLVQELESDDASIDRVGEIIEQDLAMSAKVLQLTNSSFFGLPQHVSSPRHAVSLLGLSIVRPLGLTAGAFSQFEPHGEGFSLDRAIEHGLAVATTARRIAELEESDAHLVDDSFIAGLLHDIGKLVLFTHLPSTFEDCQQQAEMKETQSWKAELELMGTTHAEVGAHLLDRWGLPTPIVEAVALHHRPHQTTSTEFTPLTAVHAANYLQSSDFPGDATGVSAGIDLDYLAALKLTDRLDIWRTAAHREPPVAAN